MSVEPSTLERSALERKDREELTTIAQALGAKPPSRARKADIVQLILELTGVEPRAGASDGEPNGRDKEASVDDNGESRGGTGESDDAPVSGDAPPVTEASAPAGDPEPPA